MILRNHVKQSGLLQPHNLRVKLEALEDAALFATLRGTLSRIAGRRRIIALKLGLLVVQTASALDSALLSDAAVRG
jgi:hypothetical protein